MSTGPLVDGFGRVATDLRISVTDRCDLRCTYCMPEEGLTWAPAETVLTFDEIERVAGIAKTAGVTTIRLTGGEPLMRRDLPDLIQRISTLGFEDISMTTNGTTLERHARALKDAGLNRVNVSLDSLVGHRFAAITRRDRLEKVLAGLRAAAEAGLLPLKVNCVVVKGVNDDELIDFADLARELSCDVRFIEFLPLDADHTWTAQDVVPSREVLQTISDVYPLVSAKVVPGQPATVFDFADGAPGSIGVIASVTEPFCSTCDRLRLTADGQFRTCLFSTDEVDLRALLRGDASDNDIGVAMATAVTNKQAGHGIGSEIFVRPKRSMSMIGG